MYTVTTTILIIKNNERDLYSSVVIFKSKENAIKYLQNIWKEDYKEETSNNEEIMEEKHWCYEDLARIYIKRKNIELDMRYSLDNVVFAD